MKIKNDIKLVIIGIFIFINVITIPYDILLIFKRGYYLNVNSKKQYEVKK